MRLAVFDTNVIVSAAIQQDGTPAKLVKDWALQGQMQLVTCPGILAEYREVTRRDTFRRFGFPPLWLEFLIEESMSLPEPLPWKHSLPDPKDALFLSLAHRPGAWLVTGNLKHFPEDMRRGVRVIAPAEYLKTLVEKSV